jgi:hypothetical protein
MGCLIQLRDGVYQRKMRTRVIHLAEVLEQAMNSSVSDIDHISVKGEML